MASELSRLIDDELRKVEREQESKVSPRLKSSLRIKTVPQKSSVEEPSWRELSWWTWRRIASAALFGVLLLGTVFLLFGRSTGTNIAGYTGLDSQEELARPEDMFYDQTPAITANEKEADNLETDTGDTEAEEQSLPLAKLPFKKPKEHHLGVYPPSRQPASTSTPTKQSAAQASKVLMAAKAPAANPPAVLDQATVGKMQSPDTQQLLTTSEDPLQDKGSEATKADAPSLVDGLITQPSAAPVPTWSVKLGRKLRQQ